jgi:thiamine phosphate synthase YjbQ (UPF0047 family)
MPVHQEILHVASAARGFVDLGPAVQGVVELAGLRAVRDDRLALGTWQALEVVEHRSTLHMRTVIVTVLG